MHNISNPKVKALGFFNNIKNTMNLVFVQTRGLNKRSFVLKEDKIIIENKTLGKINNYEIKSIRSRYSLFGR